MNILRLILISLMLMLANNKACFSNIQSNNSFTKIKSKTIHVQRKSGVMEFNNNAIIESGDSSILADKMIIFFDEKAKDKSQSLKRVEAIGNVKIFNQEFVVTGKNGFYNPADKSFTVENEVILNNGTSIAKGEKFIYNLNTKKGFLVGAKNQKSLMKKEENSRVMVIINEGK